MTSTAVPTVCPALLHDTRWAYEHHGCRCPDAVAGNRCKATARRALTRSPGRITPRHDVDIDRVAAAVRGETAMLSAEERRLAVTRLFWTGATAVEMAQQLNVTERTVQRDLRRLQEAGVVV